jgi:hypothetical protein
LWTLRKTAAEKVSVFWGRRLMFVTRAQTFANRALAVSTVEVFVAEQGRFMQIRQVGWLRRFLAFTWAQVAATWALVTANLALTGVWILAIGAAFALAVVIAVGLLIFPFVTMVFVLYKAFKMLGDVIAFAWEKLDALVDLMSSGNVGRLLSTVVDAATNIPGLQVAGLIAEPAIIGGQQGIAGISAPRLDVSNPLNISGLVGAGEPNINIQPAAVNIDGREVAEIVFDHRLDRIARR